MRTVSNILETKDEPLHSIEPTAMVIDALKKLISVNLSYLIVYENDAYAGIFSERDYTRKLVLEGRSSRDTMVKDAMTTELPRHVSNFSLRKVRTEDLTFYGGVPTMNVR